MARRQIALLLLALGACPVAALVIGDAPAGAIARGRWLLETDSALGLHVEPGVFAFVRARPGLLDLATAFYVVAHIGVAGWVLVWTWCLRRDCFRRLRDTYLWLQALLVTCWVLVPTAPARLVPGSGIGPAGVDLDGLARTLQSPWAAIPSGHVAFAVVAGTTFARIGDRAWLRAFGWAYPPLVVLVTVATGNHLLLDAVAGALAAAVAARAAAPSRSRARTRRVGQARVSQGEGAAA